LRGEDFGGFWSSDEEPPEEEEEEDPQLNEETPRNKKW
jgi:hypothetical protein